MYGDLVLERYNSQVPFTEFLAYAPKTISVVFLLLDPYWILQHSNTPFLFQISPFTQNLILKIICKPILHHMEQDKPNEGSPRSFTQVSRRFPESPQSAPIVALSVARALH